MTGNGFFNDGPVMLAAAVVTSLLAIVGALFAIRNNG